MVLSILPIIFVMDLNTTQMKSFLLVRLSYSDTTQCFPELISDNQDWLVKSVPAGYVLNKSFPTIHTFLNKNSSEYYEIRTVEKLIKEPYVAPILETMTKKQFKSMVDVYVYGKGINRRVRLFFDWKQNLSNGNNYIGYKYMLKGYGVTKERILTDAYDILIKNESGALCWYDMKVAQTDNDRFKVPVCG